MEPWYRVATPRAEVREGRSFNPDEFAIALEQVVAGEGESSRSRRGSRFERLPRVGERAAIEDAVRYFGLI
jgi:hypothetical protein